MKFATRHPRRFAAELPDDRDSGSSARIGGLASRRRSGEPCVGATPAPGAMRARDACTQSPDVDLAAFLAHHAIEAKRFEHPAVMTVEESERLVPRLPGAKTKNLFLRDRKGTRHLLVTVVHDVAVDLDSLGLLLGVGRLGLASPERLKTYLGIAPGAVSLLALANDTRHAVDFVLDRRLWEADAVQAHPLVNDATMVIPHRQLERFLQATGHAPRIVDIPTRTARSR